jgi:hypothetical protein
MSKKKEEILTLGEGTDRQYRNVGFKPPQAA